MLRRQRQHARMRDGPVSNSRKPGFQKQEARAEARA